MGVREIIEKFGGQSTLANALGIRQSAIAYWAKTDSIPSKWHKELLSLAIDRGIYLSAEDIIGDIKNMGTTKISNKNNEILDSHASLGTTPVQASLFHVEKQIEFQDVEMGVLESGVPYLTGRGLAKMIGIDHAPFHRLTTNWEEERYKPRGKAISQLLDESGYVENSLYLKAEFNGIEVNAFTEPVCLALLEYYAFVAEERREKAISAFRSLARIKFREFVYQAVGYSPDQKVLDSWRHFHDRIDMTADAVPFGYFSIFKEIAAMIVPMIRAGIMISDRVVPDISVGKAWSAYWEEQGLSITHGERTKYEHEYPLYYPQSKSNPQPSFAYPDSALGVFRYWLRQNYIANKFPTYLLGQTKKGTVPLAIANKAIEAFSGTQIGVSKPKGLPYKK